MSASGGAVAAESTQLELAWWQTKPVDREKLTLEQRFEAFDAANPHVLEEMLRLARAELRAGETRIGVKALWELLREAIRVRKLGNWKLNNSFTALYARRLIELEPALAGVIETRRRKSP
jgi:hypothetical protein